MYMYMYHICTMLLCIIKLIGSEKMDSPLKYFTSKWNSLLQINHVNPCRVPKKSVVILLCVCSIIYIQEIGVVILLLYKKYNEYIKIITVHTYMFQQQKKHAYFKYLYLVHISYTHT